MNSASWKIVLVCFVMGALLVCAFAPFELYPIGFLSLAVLFYCWDDLTPRASFLAGLSFGYGLYGVGVSWVYISLATYGGMPFWMGAIAVLGFAGILALFIALTGYSVARFFPNNRWLALPFVWSIFEWAKSWVLTGFPWLDVGYTQTPSWLFGWAPIGGIYLLGLMVAIIASCLAYAIKKRSLVLPASLLVTVFSISWMTNSISWSQPIGEPLQIGVVQPNTPIEEKWPSAYRDQVIGKLARLSGELNQAKRADLIIWPETALPLYLQQTDKAFWDSIAPQGSALLTGIMDSPQAADGSYNDVYNAAVLVCQGEPTVYRKRHLVPFGEYLPLRFLFNWVLEYLQLPMSDLASWQGPQALNCGSAIKVGLSICYEDAFAAEYRANVGDATMLINISEDAWFGDSLAPHQRLQMAQMRARELARPLVRSANSGPSMIINESGQVLAKTSQFEVQVLSYQLQPHTGETPFKRFGNWVIALSFALLALLAGLNRWTKTKPKNA